MDDRAYNALFNGMRALAERANIPLTQWWMALRHLTLSPLRIGAIVAGALVLTMLEQEIQ